MTIVRYDPDTTPKDRYPRLIVSPVSPSPCCAKGMKRTGRKERGEGGWPYFYKRCQVCGYTVREFLGPEEMGQRILERLRDRRERAARHTRSIRGFPSRSTGPRSTAKRKTETRYMGVKT